VKNSWMPRHLQWDLWLTERRGAASIARKQQERVRAIVEFARSRSPYYRQLYRMERARLRDPKAADWHYTPEHGGWHNIAECELSVLAAQCLDQRIPDKDALIREVAAWADRRNRTCAQDICQFATADARIKLKRLYPVVKKEQYRT
jgi:hypothetical protein